MDTRPLHLDLFSGIGGFALAAQWAGFRTVQFCEIDPFCQKVLAKNFPGVPVHDDIKTLSGESVGPVDVVTGGFPCQPVSQAGKRRGSADDRYLWPEMARIVSEVRPRWVLGENVAGLISMGLDQCLSDLEDLGYDARAVVVPACAVGAPHRRDRVWIVAHDQRERVPHDGRRAVAGTPSSGQGDGQERERVRPDARECGDARGSGLDADASGGGVRRGDAPRETGQPAQLREAVPDTNCSRLQDWDGEPGWRPGPHAMPPGASGSAGGFAFWATEPGVGRVDHGIPKRVDRLRSLGNAIVPQVAYQFLKEML
jgi:DNA (cytosine-5)-methyltransferase 1